MKLIKQYHDNDYNDKAVDQFNNDIAEIEGTYRVIGCNVVRYEQQNQDRTYITIEWDLKEVSADEPVRTSNNQ